MAIARRSAVAPPNERPWRLSVVLPVYNEKNTFREVIELLLAKTIPGLEIEICLIESNSTDGTREDVLAYAVTPEFGCCSRTNPRGRATRYEKDWRSRPATSFSFKMRISSTTSPTTKSYSILFAGLKPVSFSARAIRLTEATGKYVISANNGVSLAS